MKTLAAAILLPLVGVVLAAQKTLALGESEILLAGYQDVTKPVETLWLRKAGRHRSRHNLRPLRRRVPQDEDRIVQTCPAP